VTAVAGAFSIGDLRYAAVRLKTELRLRTWRFKVQRENLACIVVGISIVGIIST
jgi:hypothetical protein